MFAKAAVAARKARGTKLGGFRGHHFTDEHHAAARASVQARADARVAEMAPVIAELKEVGVTSFGALAKALTERGIPAARGGSVWTAMQVKRVVDRLAASR